MLLWFAGVMLEGLGSLTHTQDVNTKAQNDKNEQALNSHILCACLCQNKFLDKCNWGGTS